MRIFRIFDIIKIIKKIREINPDVIHILCSKMPNSILIALLWKKYPIILSIHGLTKIEYQFQHGIHYFIERFIGIPLENFALSHLDNFILMTPYENVYIQNHDAAIRVIPAGVDDEYFDIISAEKTSHLLFVGGIQPRKGLIDLLKAMKIIVEEHPDITLDIAGAVISREYFVQLQKFVIENSLTENVNFLGYVNESLLHKKFSETTIFVFPSYEESQGIVILEAMASKKPVIASNIGGIPYVLQDGVTGLLFECGDVEDLAKKISILLGNKELRQQMGESGQQIARLYSWKSIAQKTLDFYLKVHSKYCDMPKVI